jgi:hypothetical protein
MHDQENIQFRDSHRIVADKLAVMKLCRYFSRCKDDIKMALKETQKKTVCRTMA